MLQVHNIEKLYLLMNTIHKQISVGLINEIKKRPVTDIYQSNQVTIEKYRLPLTKVLFCASPIGAMPETEE